MKRLALLGSTGSIGTQTLDVVSRHPDKITITAISAGKNLDVLLPQAERFSPELIVVADEETAQKFKKAAPSFQGRLKWGEQALTEAATHPQVTHVVVALVGSLGLVPTLRALELGRVVALANKETLVAGGHLVHEVLNKNGGTLIPIDSEHSAIFQCLKGESMSEVKTIWLTASGGPFRGYTKEKLKKVTKEQVLHHPIWKMGNKITVDSASLMNKGLEVIEAKWLFGVSPEQIRVVVHPQGIIHSMVEFVDGSVIAQLGLPDMKTPIQVALSFPERWDSPSPRLNLAQVGTLTFEEPDLETFPLLRYAFEVASEGGSLPTVLNAANEEAVRLFLDEDLPFCEIPDLIHAAMKSHQKKTFPSLPEVLEADRWARQFVKEAGSREKSTTTKP